jgi:hypothetical protein
VRRESTFKRIFNKKGVSFRFVSFRFVSFRFVSFRFVLFCFVLFCFVLFCGLVLVFQAEKLLTAEQAQLATILRQNQSVLGKLKPAAVVRGNLLPPFFFSPCFKFPFFSKS